MYRKEGVVAEEEIPWGLFFVFSFEHFTRYGGDALKPFA